MSQKTTWEAAAFTPFISLSHCQFGWDKWCVYPVCVCVGEFHNSWRHLWRFSPRNWQLTCQLATSPVCKMPYFVACVGLVACTLEFLGGIWLVFGCLSPVDMICCVCVCVVRQYWWIDSLTRVSDSRSHGRCQTLQVAFIHSLLHQLTHYVRACVPGA